MALYKSIIAYDGSDFQGFQRQEEGIRTVQGVLEEALRELAWKESSLIAAGRTDSGVHARGQVISYRLVWRHGPKDLTRAINASLPLDVAVRNTEVAPDGFHPRNSAKRRRYSFRMVADRLRQPLMERYAWRVWPEPDVERMQSAARLFIGKHDFGAFGRGPRPTGHTRRQVFEAAWEQRSAVFRFEVEGDAFLHHMVRRIVAAMYAVGIGRTTAGLIKEHLAEPQRRWNGDLAGASGLCLEAVFYD